MRNNDPLDDAREWSAVESTDESIEIAYFESRIDVINNNLVKDIDRPLIHFAEIAKALYPYRRVTNG